jgi:isoamylase
MLSVVINPYFDWGHDRPPRHEYHDTVIYEAHVKGLTMTHPEVPEEIRGTYAGHRPPGDHRPPQHLGVTAIELMPVHQFVQDTSLQAKGLTQLLGLQHDRLPRPAQRVRRGRRGSRSPSSRPWSRRCTRPASRSSSTSSTTTPPRATTWARRCASAASTTRPTTASSTTRALLRHTGTGNSLLMRHPHVLQLIMDSLRYWVTEMHVDGFRFDLAATLARQFHEVDKLSAFFDLIQQDPVISQVKLIAEPWDVGDGGYQVGNFPPLWTEWNGKYRDTVRDFWRGEAAPSASSPRA